MEKIIDKFDLFSQHLNNTISDTFKKIDRATFQDKFNKPTDAKDLLRAA